MRRIIIKEARTGMRAARAIAHPRDPAQVVVASGAELTGQQIIMLHEIGLYDLWIEEPEMNYFDALSASQLTVPQQRLCEALLRAFRSFAAASGGGAGVDAQKLLLRRNSVVLEEMMHTLVAGAALVPSLAAMATQHEELLTHSANVCVLATLLGLQLEGYLIEQRPRLNCRQARDVLNLAMGCIFHDVGELVMPVKQRESQADLAFLPAAGDEWKQHTHQGYGAVRPFLDPSAATTVLHHHQHFDGSGFACTDSREIQQRGEGIHIFSRIAMAADVFQHLLCSTDAGVPHPTVRALWEIQQEPVRNWFDPTVLEALLAIVPAFVPGMVVTLNDRRQAIVTRVSPDAACYPEVQVLREEATGTAGEKINLAESDDLAIAEVGGANVERYLFGAKRQLAAA